MWRIELSIIMYILLVGGALITGALSAIVFMGVYRKTKRGGTLVGTLLLLWIVYQMVTLSTIASPLTVMVLVIYLFFGIAAYWKLKREGVIAKG
ncbi:hypothetical protein H1Q58_12465 [Planococcus maritimus]|uniref:Uncharacterized protein n=1 Tax=Planococcus maritimus TaxID=192421 RepID=A0A7D7MDT8_PLAMR|nr:hypothetical protein [Planococcus maritimus]QMT16773.1 hypothetical protein H1Q58_12465 [Planococcus maritimus]